MGGRNYRGAFLKRRRNHDASPRSEPEPLARYQPESFARHQPESFARYQPVAKPFTGHQPIAESEPAAKLQPYR